MARVIRARYEGGVLKPLDNAELEEGGAYRLVIEEDVEDLTRRYRGRLGSSSAREFQELKEEAQMQ